MRKIYFFILFVAILIVIGGKPFAQGIGNHLTFSLENCTYPALNIIQFDLFVTSDGVSTSDLRPNSFSFGINFDTCILQSGATVSPSYVTGTTDTIFPSPGLGFPISAFRYHIRITQAPCAQCNSNYHSMIIGHKYRIGTIRLTSTANYTTCCPNFSFQDSGVSGKTRTEGLIYIDNNCCDSTCCIYTFLVSGTGDGQCGFMVNNCVCSTGIDENNADALIKIFPNPSHNQIEIKGNEIQSLTLCDVLGRIVWLSKPEIISPLIINTFSFSRGIYFLQAKTKSGIVMRKIVLE